MSVELLNIDCLDYMRGLPDKAFDLAIVDPPYGIGENWKKDRYSKFYTHTSSYKNNGIPGEEFFTQLFRVSKNQIVFGANYYTAFLPARQGWIIWDKRRNYDDSHMAEAELAWHSFNIPARIVSLVWNGFIRCEDRHGVHPHEKPTKLYAWILKNYGRTGDKILDTHLGSASSAIAAHKLGFDFVGCEIDKDYYEAAVKRYKEQVAMPLFD